MPENEKDFMTTLDPITLEVFKHLILAIPEEMGANLRRTAFSVNIKERMDESCALFDAKGRLFAQAEHIPVHLGAMPSTVEAVMADFPQLQPGDQVMVNDPYRGGSHLPDITLIAPFFWKGKLKGYAVNRAHHADIGGVTPGSMPGESHTLAEEGMVIPPTLWVRDGEMQKEIIRRLREETRNPQERLGDLNAQAGANILGVSRCVDFIRRYGEEAFDHFIEAIISYSKKYVLSRLQSFPEGSFSDENAPHPNPLPRGEREKGFHDSLCPPRPSSSVSASPSGEKGFYGSLGRPTGLNVSACDYLDGEDGGIPIQVRINLSREGLTVDFHGTAAQSAGNLNAPLSVTKSAVYYVVRCLFLSSDVPPNHGCYELIRVMAPEGTLLNPRPPAAVSSGNVETSQRIVDVLLLAFAQMLPERVPAQAQGTMNNVAFGWKGQTYYETIAGGMGATSSHDGASGVQVHMTNTANTPVEVLEAAYPIRLTKTALRSGSGGTGRFRGGMGISREFFFLEDTIVSIQSERRIFPPRGLAGGGNAQCGVNLLRHLDGTEIKIPGRITFTAHKGETLIIKTPGGGGWGKVPVKSINRF